MAGNIRGHIAGLLQTSKRHSRYVGVLALLAVVVALGVTMGLRRNGRAATVEQTVLDCHAAAGVAHTHSADCYDADGNLVCPLQERELHVHDDSCYNEEGNLTCGKDEVTEEHVHSAGCFKTVTVTVDDPEPAAEAPAEDEGPDYAQAEAEAAPMPSQIFEEKVDRTREVRRLGVGAVDVRPRGAAGTQLELLIDEPELDEEHARTQALNEIRSKFGSNAILKGMDFLPNATTRERNSTIGGHRSGK